MASPTLAETLVTKKGDDWRSRWLLRYILCAATMAFTGRAAPLAFLPLVLKESFGQSDGVIGLVMAVYPCAALLTTPWAARLSRRSIRIVRLHSWAIICVAVAMMLTSLAERVKDVLGAHAGVLWIVLCRAVQGLGASLYLSSNTSLITRKFPSKLAYVIAMTEVAVGSGGQLGRICGGFLFDFGGFACPFMLIGLCQTLLGLIGFSFEDSSVSEHDEVDTSAAGNADARASKTMPWSQLLSPRLCTGALAAFMMYFIACFADATLLQYLMVHLRPVSVATLSVGMSTRGTTYLMGSFGIAQLMHRELISFERLIAIGAFMAILGQMLMGPQPFVTALETDASGTPSRFVLWTTVILSFVFAQLGGALMFVPSLPLMQNEVKKHGEQVVEQVAELFVIMMTMGEMIGPIFGGWLVGHIGFVAGTAVLATLCLPLLLMALCTYDADVIRGRQRVPSEPQEAAADLCGPGCGGNCAPFVPSDGEASFAWRRIPFALDVKRALQLPSSAPSSVFRRMYGEAGQAERPYMTAPHSSRRVYGSDP